MDFPYYCPMSHGMTKKVNFHSQNATVQRRQYAVLLGSSEMDSICFNALLPCFKWRI